MRQACITVDDLDDVYLQFKEFVFNIDNVHRAAARIDDSFKNGEPSRERVELIGHLYSFVRQVTFPTEPRGCPSCSKRLLSLYKSGELQFCWSGDNRYYLNARQILAVWNANYCNLGFKIRQFGKQVPVWRHQEDNCFVSSGGSGETVRERIQALGQMTSCFELTFDQEWETVFDAINGCPLDKDNFVRQRLTIELEHIKRKWHGCVDERKHSCLTNAIPDDPKTGESNNHSARKLRKNATAPANRLVIMKKVIDQATTGQKDTSFDNNRSKTKNWVERSHDWTKAESLEYQKEFYALVNQLLDLYPKWKSNRG